MMSNYSLTQNNYYQKSVPSSYTQNNDMYQKGYGTMQKSRRLQNNGSKILKDEENQTLFRLCGPNAISLAAGVCQLLRSSPKPNSVWEVVSPGVIVFCKDYERRLYCLRLYCLAREELIWEQIMYVNFMPEYLWNKKNMLVFEGEKCMFCLNFTSDTEAGIFYDHFQRRLMKEKENAAKATKSQDTKLQNTNQGSVISHSTGISAMGAVPFYSPTQKTSTLFGNGKDEKKSKKKEKGRKICKEDISFPSNFQRIAHIGFDQHSGFQHTVSDSSAIDDSVKDVIKAAGFNPDNMNHDEIKFAKEFVSNYDPFDPNKYRTSSNDPFNAWGDVPSINRYSTSQTNYHESSYNPPVTHKKNMAPLPAYNVKSNTPNYYNYNQYPHNIQTPQPVQGKYYNDFNNSTQRTTPAPPPPIRKDINNFQNEISGKATNNDMMPIRTAPTAPKRPTNMPPPPPPPVKSNRPPPPPPVLQSLNPISTKQLPAPTIPSSGGSCAPPPPPLPPPGLLKNPTSPQKPQPPTINGRGDLLAEIQNGKTLRKVEQNSSEGGKTNNTRDDLLAQIQRGTNLRHVESSDNEVQNRKSSTNIYQAEGIAGALARALEERRKNMVASDSEDSVSDNDEWDSD